MLDSIYHMTLKLLQSKKSGKDQESKQSSTTPDPARESVTNTIKHHKGEPNGQLFPSR